jgi:hypothetical protein
MPAVKHSRVLGHRELMRGAGWYTNLARWCKISE